MMKILGSILGILASQALYSQTVTLEELKQRIEELEKQQKQMLSQVAEPRPKVNSFLNDDLTFGGFFEPSMSFIAGPDTDAQMSPANFLGINLAADFKSNFRFVGQFLTTLSVNLDNPHNDPRAKLFGQPESREFSSVFFGSSLSQGYIEYFKSRSLTIQMGLGYVPFGYALQQRELVLFVRRGGPQLLRTTSLVSPFWSGFNISGSVPLNNHEVGYNLYTFTPPERKSPGVGGRVWMASAEQKIVGGLSAQIGKNKFETVEIIGADVKFDWFPYLVKAEIIQQLSKNDDPWSMYVEPGVYVMDEEILLYIFGDYANSALNETGGGRLALKDPYAKWEYGGGLNWLPTSYTRFRLGLTFYDYVGKTAVIGGQNRDYVGLDVSAGIAF